jgi:UDP-glucuronate decarboxylase
VQGQQTCSSLSPGSRVLVTGGAGFLGSHLSERLLEDGHEVVVLDSFLTGSRRNLWHLLEQPGLEVVRHDVAEPYSVEVDFIFNLACPASPVWYQRDPVQTMRTNVLGTLNALELARRLRVPMVQASTSEVYGDPEVSPQSEKYWGRVNPIGPRSCYDEGKRAAETLCMDFAEQYGVDTRIVRIFNTYGPKMALSDGRVVSNFIVQALSGQPITIYGDGSQTRSFCFVDDLIGGFMAIAALGDLAAPVNLGNDAEFSIESLARLVVRLCNSLSPIEHLPLPTDDPVQRRPDLGRARELIDWQPSVPLEEGLQRTITYFAQQ